MRQTYKVNKDGTLSFNHITQTSGSGNPEALNLSDLPLSDVHYTYIRD